MRNILKTKLNSDLLYINLFIIFFLYNLEFVTGQQLIRGRVLKNTTLYLSQRSICNDTDSDLICDDYDNCPGIYNPTQSDIDNDGIGDICDPNPNNFNLPNPPCVGGANCTTNQDCDDNNICTLDICINIPGPTFGTCMNIFDPNLNDTCDSSVTIFSF
jgi:hypothetical protein